MIRRPLLASLLLLSSAAAFGQTMYRCGNTFSQTPCGSDGKAASVPAPSGAVAGGSTAAKAQPCVAELAARVGVEDPKALKIGRIDGPKVQAIDHRNDKLVVRTYELTVSTRNVHGGYTGAVVYTCHLSEDEQRLVEMREGRTTR